MVLRRVADVVVSINSTGLAAIEDLATAFGAFGVFLPINIPVTTGLSDVWIGARAELQTDSEAVAVSNPVHVGGWTK